MRSLLGQSQEWRLERIITAKSVDAREAILVSLDSVVFVSVKLHEMQKSLVFERPAGNFSPNPHVQ